MKTKELSRRPAKRHLYACLTEVAIAASDVATYCDRSEHGQPADREVVIKAARTLREQAAWLAARGRCNIYELYAQRLIGIEQASLMDVRPSLRPGNAVAKDATWADLQDIQICHDRHYHPDVFGMSRMDQLRHYAFHLAKFPGAIVSLGPPLNAPWERFTATRLPDMLLFGLKLSTVMGEQIPGAPSAG